MSTAASSVWPAARNLRNYHGTGGIAPFVNGTVEWGLVIATFLSVLSIVHRPCARLTYFLHPKLRKLNAAPVTRQLPCGTCGAQEAFSRLDCTTDAESDGRGHRPKGHPHGAGSRVEALSPGSSLGVM